MTGDYGTQSTPLDIATELGYLEPRTSDPSTLPGPALWFREDLADTQATPAQLGTVRWYDGSKTQDIPIFDEGTSDSGVAESVRVKTPNGLGYLPIAERDLAEFRALSIQHNNTVYALHDDIEPGAIADSVTNQYRAEEFATPWPDNIGSADMSVTGLTQSTFSNGEDSVFGDGSGDFGTADVLNIGAQETYGLAVTVEKTATGDILGQLDDPGNTSDIIRFQDSGFIWEVNSNTVQIDWSTSLDDGNIHAVVLNKAGDSGTDFEVYVDDMSDADDEATVSSDQGASHTNYNLGPTMGFFGVYDAKGDGSFSTTELDAGVFEVKSDPYTEQERLDFVNRRAEV